MCVLTGVCIENSLLATKGAVVLLVILHNNQTSDAKCVAAAKLHRPPLDLKAHGTGVVVDLGNVRENLRVDFGADCFGEVL